MQEFASVSASSYDPAALVAKLNERAAEGWSVVAIVPTGGDVTAFLSRGGAAAAEAGAAVAAPVVVAEPEPVVVAEVVAPEPAPAVAEPAGWAVAPEPEPAPVDPTPAATYQPVDPTPSYTYQPAPAPQPAYTPTPAVPAGWYADPAGRFELRYWDGGQWTEHVSRAGQQFTDPPVA
ncbi:MAG: DUF2510 domain-containing protein [Actinomycetota bacterium]